MRTVTVPCGFVDVEADVEKLDDGAYVVLWTDEAAVRALGLSGSALARLAERCEVAFEGLELLREAEGVSSLLNDSAGLANSDRDHRMSEGA